MTRHHLLRTTNLKNKNNIYYDWGMHTRDIFKRSVSNNSLFVEILRKLNSAGPSHKRRRERERERMAIHVHGTLKGPACAAQSV